jgi:Protein of unknown function (DUF2783)
MAGSVLDTAPGADPDGLYQLLVEAHRDLTDAQSRLVDAKLVLLLANHIGDPAVIAAAVAAARAGVADPGTPAPENR